ncbi:carbohydrate kinase [Roseibium aggregatum IAM 12614]|uniref:Carbohydrate kinase n=1 Tax=Roseibium aggregatum (strain ATCC 25650 / DSM 13394 / JCM 20685 / NBRC 16684 / NCIMB 2208 / IAM 12614 / B1) TaxID=384765 RepID=A0NP92_ROSAI|nr:carbohydrate kinase [Roseibium aggregatum IAM 12614]
MPALYETVLNVTSPHSSSVIAIGAIHYDTIAHASEPIRPETSTPSRLSAKPGGVATNIARALVRLDVRTHLVGTVGDDGPADMLSRQLHQEGLVLHVLARPGFATGQYLALHNPAGDLAAACVDDSVLSEAPEDLFDAIVEQLAAGASEETIWFLDANLPAAMLARLAGLARPGRLIANAVSDAKAIRLRGVLDELDCLMLNRGEAATLTGLSREASSEDLAAALMQTGLKSFVLTSAAADVLVLEGGKLHRFAPLKTQIVDVTGAGDALTAGTVAALSKGYGLTEALPFGLSAAALTLRCTGALADELTWDALADF